MKRQKLLDRDRFAGAVLHLGRSRDAPPSRGQAGHAQATATGSLTLQARDHITIEVLPFGAGAYPALNGSFVIHGFPDAADADVLFQEGPEGDEISSDNPAMLSRYQNIFEELRHMSLGPQGSLNFLDDLAKELS